MHKLLPGPENPLTFIDLFSGCGGLSLGFLQAGFQGLLALDSDSRAVKVYNHNLKGNRDQGAEVCDLKTLETLEDVQRFLFNRGIEHCDVLVGGPPCQSFSVVGINKTRALARDSEEKALEWQIRHETRAGLFEVYALFLEALRPRWFVFENVPSIRSNEAFANLAHRFSSLQDSQGNALKYYFDTRCPNTLASRHGVPQNRWRFLMVGERSDLASTVKWRPPPERPSVTVSEALDDLPVVQHGHKETNLPYGIEPETAYQHLMRGPDLNGQIVPLVNEHICRRHNSDDVALFDRMGPGARFADSEVQQAMRDINPEHHLCKYATDKFGDKLHRLDPDRPAWTVTAHLSRDCYKFIHHRSPRTISVREAARLQSFPDWFSFAGLGLNAAFSMIGNAVPPLMARQLAESILVTDQTIRTDTGSSFGNEQISDSVLAAD